MKWVVKWKNRLQSLNELIVSETTLLNVRSIKSHLNGITSDRLTDLRSHLNVFLEIILTITRVLQLAIRKEFSFSSSSI